jgi:hypothetical protein
VTCNGYDPDPKLNKECNSNGRCTREGTCDCDNKHEGEFCQIERPAEVSDFLGEDIYVYMGIHGMDEDGSFELNNVDFTTADAQLAALELCRSFCPETSEAGAELLASRIFDDGCARTKSLRAHNSTGTWQTTPPRAKSAMFMNKQENRALQFRRIESCAFAQFFDTLTDKTLPIPNIGQQFYTFMKIRNFEMVAGFDLSVKDDAKLLWTSVKLQTGISTRTGAFDAVAKYDEWDAYVDRVGVAVAAIAPEQQPDAKSIKMGSPLFARSVTEIAAVQGTVDSFLISNLCALASIFVFTRNPVIALATWLSIVLIVGILLGFMVLVFEWEFGVIEAISVTVFVGLSVDYCLHIANSFNESGAATTYLRVRSGLTQTGVSVVGAAITTIGSSFFLLFCDIKLFQQFGQVSMMSLLVASLVSTIFLPALLILVGPMPGKLCPDIPENWRRSRPDAIGGSVRESDVIRGGAPESQ